MNCGVLLKTTRSSVRQDPAQVNILMENRSTRHEIVIPSHPVRVQIVRRAGLVLAPKLHFRPMFAIFRNISTAWTTRHQSAAGVDRPGGDRYSPADELIRHVIRRRFKNWLVVRSAPG